MSLDTYEQAGDDFMRTATKRAPAILAGYSLRRNRRAPLSRPGRICEPAWRSSGPSGAARDIDLVPLPLFVVAAETGGQVLGAFDGDRFVGFTLAFPGLRERQPFLHSHMTGVLDALLESRCCAQAEAVSAPRTPCRGASIESNGLSIRWK